MSSSVESIFELSLSEKFQLVEDPGMTSHQRLKMCRYTNGKKQN